MGWIDFVALGGILLLVFLAIRSYRRQGGCCSKGCSGCKKGCSEHAKACCEEEKQKERQD